MVFAIDHDVLVPGSGWTQASHEGARRRLHYHHRRQALADDVALLGQAGRAATVVLLRQAGRAFPTPVGLHPIPPHLLAVAVAEDEDLTTALVLILDHNDVVALVLAFALGLTLSLALIGRGGNGREPRGQESGDERSQHGQTSSRPLSQESGGDGGAPRGFARGSPPDGR